jgi:hypothetical protein
MPPSFPCLQWVRSRRHSVRRPGTRSVTCLAQMVSIGTLFTFFVVPICGSGATRDPSRDAATLQDTAVTAGSGAVGHLLRGPDVQPGWRPGIRFLIWLVIGFVGCFGYGRRHSRLARVSPVWLQQPHRSRWWERKTATRWAVAPRRWMTAPRAYRQPSRHRPPHYPGRRLSRHPSCHPWHKQAVRVRHPREG